MDVVVGRIGRPHGLRGERDGRGAHRRPRGAGSRRAAAAAHRPGRRAGPLTIDDGCACTAVGCCCTSRASTDRTAAEGLRGVLLVADVDLAERLDDPDEFYDHQLVGLRGPRPWPASARRRGRRGAAPARPGRAGRAPAGRHARCSCPFVADDRAPTVDLDAGRVAGRPAARPAGRRTPTTSSGADDAHRRRHDLPRLPRPAATLSLIGRAVEDGLLDAARARPARLDARPAPHRRRHAVRRRARHGHDARAVGRGPRRGRRPPAAPSAPARLRRADARAAGRSPRRSPHELAAEPWLVFACGRYEGIDQRVLDEAADRLAGCVEVSLGDYVARRRRGGRAGRSSRRSPGCCPVCSATPSRWSRSRTPTGCWRRPVYTKPASLARPRRARRCCSPATTRGSRAGAATRRCARTAARRPDLLDRLDPGHARPARPRRCSPSWAGHAGDGRLAAPDRPVAD